MSEIKLKLTNEWDIDLYDRKDIISFDKIEEFIKKYMLISFIGEFHFRCNRNSNVSALWIDGRKIN